jgi:hypothetical protein
MGDGRDYGAQIAFRVFPDRYHYRAWSIFSRLGLAARRLVAP